MEDNYEIDSVDRGILEALRDDARKPFLEIARKVGVSGGTIHQRVEKLKEAGILTGSGIQIDYRQLGYGVTVILGIHLTKAGAVESTIRKLKKLKEVLEVYYTTGSYALLIKVILKDIDHFHRFLVKDLQSIEGVQSTESFICLDKPIDRHPTL